MIETLNDNVNEIITLADQLQQLITAKQDMKTALSDKGVVPTGGLTSYADAIRSIESGGEGGIKLPNGTKFIRSTFTTVPLFDTSEMTSMYDMFGDCELLTTVPLFDTSKVTIMYGMFAECKSLTTVPLFDTSKVTNMYDMFYKCSSLRTIPQFDTSKVVEVHNMFYGCSSLVVIPQLDFSSVKDDYGYFSLRYLTKLRHVGGFVGMRGNIEIRDSGLTYDSIMNIINNLGTIPLSWYRRTIWMDSNQNALLSDSVRQSLTNRGWVLQVSEPSY